ncbi:hypothetical protein EDD86DRAFT_196463 [Gorgonomyces haynaldii]|nr:hypothetical protein EDD86DRAFT_196463 [Gorgonomyces haynaldii]
MGKPKQGGRASTAVKYKEPGLLLAQKWTETTNVEGFWISEKLDGVRAYYDHELGIFISRLGNVFQVPEFFYKGFPKDIMSLDGELYLGRGQYALTQQVLKVSDHPKWAEMKFMAFDSPSTPGVFEDRLQAVKDYFANNECPHAHVVEHQLCQSKEHMDELLKHFETLGGEGVMLRKPKSHYVPKRSATLLKVKSFYDAEARVTEHIPGKGKYTGMMGALLCQMASGVSFKVGTGFSDRDRLNPPPIGAIITYRFQEMTPDNAPRFPAFVAVRSDMTEPKDCEIPAHRRRGDDDEA